MPVPEYPLDVMVGPLPADCPLCDDYGVIDEMKIDRLRPSERAFLINRGRAYVQTRAGEFRHGVPCVCDASRYARETHAVR